MYDVIQVIKPHIPPDLVGGQALYRIEELARVLAPVNWGGFECTLDRGSPRVDFHQGLSAHSDVSKIVEAPVSGLNPGSRAGWDRIHRFCLKWAGQGSPLHESILKIGLEFDVRGTPVDTPAPSVFWSFKDYTGDHVGEQHRAAILASMEILLGDTLPEELVSNLKSFLNLCPDNAVVFHAGTMLSRSEKVLRVNIWGLNPEQIIPFLKEYGWDVPPDELGDIIDRLTEVVDTFVMGVDIGVKFYSRVGLECIPIEGNERIPGWESLLDALIDLELCTEQKRDALLDWPGISDPGSDAVFWPGSLIVESLLRDPAELSVIRRLLSHVKIDYRQGSTPESKAYLEFLPDWLDLSAGAP